MFGHIGTVDDGLGMKLFGPIFWVAVWANFCWALAARLRFGSNGWVARLQFAWLTEWTLLFYWAGAGCGQIRFLCHSSME